MANIETEIYNNITPQQDITAADYNIPYDNIRNIGTAVIEKGIRYFRFFNIDGAHWSSQSTQLPPVGSMLTNNYVLLGFQFYKSPEVGISTITEAYYADILDVETPAKWIVFRAPNASGTPPMHISTSSYKLPTMDYYPNGFTYIYILPGMGEIGGNIPKGYAVSGIETIMCDAGIKMKFIYSSVKASITPTPSKIERYIGCGDNDGRNSWPGNNCQNRGPCREDKFITLSQKHFITDVKVSYFANTEAPFIWKGLKLIEQVKFKDFTNLLMIADRKDLYISKCCSSNTAFAPNTTGKALCDSIGADVDSNGRAGGTCMAQMKTLCSDPTKITSTDCINFFKTNRNDTVGMVRDFCARAGDLAMTGDNAKICGCLMPKSYYDKYLDDNFGHSPSIRAALAAYGPECYSAECGASELKKPDSELSSCPALNVCAQQASVNAGNNITTGQLNNYNSCIFNQLGGNTIQPPTSTSSNNVNDNNNADNSNNVNNMDIPTSSTMFSPTMLLLLLVIAVLLVVIVMNQKSIFGGSDDYVDVNSF